MANTLTSLIPTIYQAIDVVSRERVGFIPAVTINSSAERAALDESILIPIAPATTAEADNSPAVSAPDTGDQTIGNVSMTISKSKHIPVRWTGEETKGLGNAGTFKPIMQQRFEQAFRRLGNLIETDLASSYKYASRGIGTPGTAPFPTAASLVHFAGPLKILEDNGAPATDLKLVISNAAMYNLRGIHSELFKVNEAGSAELLRDGKVARLMGFDLHQSGQVAAVTPGTTTDATLTSTDYAVGSTSLTLASTGTGTILEGDMVNIAGQNNGIYYGVRSGDASVADSGTVVLNAPGLTIAQTTNTSVIAPAATAWSANLAFHKNAIQLITRAPAMPEGGDMADDIAMVTDPVSGITFEIAEYKQFRRTVFHVAVAWGWQAIKQEHIAVLFG